MIIFTDNPGFINIIGGYFNRPMAVFNLSSLYSGFIDLTKLITGVANVVSASGTTMPIPEYVNSIDFDLYYISYIFNNEDVFKSFMSLLSTAYEGIICVVMVQRDGYRDTIMESLIKIIQQRYGYNSWIVSDQEDIFSVRESTFTPMGITVLKEDLTKFDQMNNYSGICIE